jgi:hypothetical protein
MKDLVSSVSKRHIVKGRDWECILDRYHKSGLKVREFSELEGIPQGTLRDRLGLSKRHKKPLDIPSFDSFIPLNLGSASSIDVELELRDGTKLRIKG